MHGYMNVKFLNSILISSTHLCLGHPSVQFTYIFPSKILFALIFSPIYAIGFTCLILLDEAHSIHIHLPYEITNLENNIIIYCVQ